MYEKTTKDISVAVQTQFLEDQSDPESDHFVWAYRVRLTNKGHETVQLINRRWRITDGTGSLHEVFGPGVVGEQPILAPGETFEYTSGTPLRTPSGIMVGEYEMVSERGETFRVAIPAFSLDSPHERATVN